MAEPNWATHRATDYRVLIAMTSGIGLLTAVSIVYVVVEHLVGVALIGAGAGWLSVAVLRRERRIRRRLADTAGTRPAPPRPRAGPGANPPAAPAPTAASDPSQIRPPGAAPRTGGTR